MSRRVVALVALLLAVAACNAGEASERPSTEPASASATPAPPPPSPTPSPDPVAGRFEPLVVRSTTRMPPADPTLPLRGVSHVAAANYPAGLAVAPDGRIFYTELYGGVIRVIERDGTLREWFDVNAHFGIEWTEYAHAGLSAIAIDPEFERNRFVYAVTQAPDEQTGIPTRSLVVRFTERNGRGARPKVILELPARRYNNVYSLVFAPDGTIFVPSGSLSGQGRDVPGDLVGEILHITRSGEPAPEGPFGAEAPLTWAHGIRNSFDLAIEPSTGYLVGADNGNHGHDEIDLIAPGRYYGWPEHEGVTPAAADVSQPLLEIPTGHWAPTGMIRYEGRRFPELRDSYLLCMNHQPGVYAFRLRLEPEPRLVSFTKIASTCSIDIAASREGRIFITDASGIYELT